MSAKPIMTDGGLWTANGERWLMSDGPFPFDACDDRTTTERNRQFVIDDYHARLAIRQLTEEAAQAHGMTLTQWYAGNAWDWYHC